MDLLERVRRTIRRHDLAHRDTGVIAALSGGSDSVALAYLLRALDGAGELRLLALAHFNHQLRPAAAADQQFCAEVAAALDRPLVTDTGDVRMLARRERRSIEDAARTARHAFLERARVDAHADVVALGHTRDDQAETFLLRLLRGAGARGLASMHPRNGPLVRPLLNCRRDELKSYLYGRHVAFVHDESNEDPGVPRNRVRAELLPFLAERFNPAIVNVLADAAEIAREEWLDLDAAAGRLAARTVRREGHRWIVATDMLNGASTAVARLVMRRAMSDAAAGRPIGFDDVEQALQLSRGAGADFDAPGHRVERIGPDVVLTSRPSGMVGRIARPDATGSRFHYPLSIPGEVELPEAGCVVSAEATRSGELARAVARSRAAVMVRGDLCAGGLSVRNRRPGDKFSPEGFGGRKKLQDFLVDRKVARPLRDFVPLVVDDRDQIVWVAGHAMDEQFRVTDPAQAVIILRLKGLGGAF
jgi:tRNA(Ile)-lysidine synthase